MIPLKEMVSRFNPILTNINTKSPLTVGNGGFAFTVDVTGLQSLYSLYESSSFPLCTMANWAWHKTPLNDGRYYSVDDVCDEKARQWLCQNPHKFNLGRVSFCYKEQKGLPAREIKPCEITDINQELLLFEGKIISRFSFRGEKVMVYTVCDKYSDTVSFEIHSSIPNLGIKIIFPYGHHGISGSDWSSFDKHITIWEQNSENSMDAAVFRRKMDDTEYFVKTQIDGAYEISNVFLFRYENHTASQCEIFWPNDTIRLSVNFSGETDEPEIIPNYSLAAKSALKDFEDFWNTTCFNIIELLENKNHDLLQEELIRKVVISLYLMKTQAMGSLPPSNSGLALDSMYGRINLDMLFWNSAYLALWNLSDRLEPILKWLSTILPKAQKLAAKSGYKGARWPRQVCALGDESPQISEPLLGLQQLHIIYILEIMYSQNKSKEFLESYWEIMCETADFMADFIERNQETREYQTMPLFYFGLMTAVKWANCLEKEHDFWVNVAKSIRVEQNSFVQVLKKLLESQKTPDLCGLENEAKSLCEALLDNKEAAIDLLLDNNSKSQVLPIFLPANGAMLLSASFILFVQYKNKEKNS